MTEVLWNRLPAPALKELARDGAIVLLPTASTEQHGPHLPTGVDTLLCSEVCRRIALRVAGKRPVVVAPAVWMGLAEHHVAFGGTFTVTLDTYHALLRDLCRSIVRAGFKHILIVNGHGGNMAALNALTSELTHELDAPIATTSYWNLPQARGAFAEILEDQKGVEHACEAETSMMLAVAPELVDKSKIEQARGPSVGMAISRPVLAWKSFADITRSGVLGDARKASAAKGERLLDTAAAMLADMLIAGELWAAAPAAALKA
jgi:creatinine amidohydrolase